MGAMVMGYVVTAPLRVAVTVLLLRLATTE
jgi:hypothetical protein